MIFHYHIHLIPKFNVNQGFKVLHETNIQARDSLNETRTLLQEKLK
jgi:diadenosine tetraphosphate (Ap4A) HIT family hydrolase